MTETEKQYGEVTDFPAGEKNFLRQIPVGYPESSYQYQGH
jgi:hypothetical protein